MILHFGKVEGPTGYCNTRSSRFESQLFVCMQVFINTEGSLYSFKGLVGRLGPIGVHASMLAILGGVAFGGISGYKGSVMIPQGNEFLVASALRPVSPLASPPRGATHQLTCLIVSPDTSTLLCTVNVGDLM